MNETNTTTTEQTVETNSEATAKLYATKVEAEANKPADAPKSLRVYEVAKAGATVGFVSALRGYDHGLASVARLEGFTVSLGNKTAPVTKEAVLAKLSELSDEELQAMGLSRKPQRGARK